MEGVVIMKAKVMVMIIGLCIAQFETGYNLPQSV